MEEIFREIDEAQEGMVALLKKWTNVNSYSDNVDGLAQMFSEIKEETSLLNGKMEEIALAPRKKIDSKGKLSEIAQGKALHIKKHEKAKCQVLLAGHYDTVYPLTSSFQKAEMIDQNTLRGPGVADMKGGLIVMLKALQIIEASPYQGQLGFEVIINPDEEVGSTGSEHLYRKAARGKVAGLIFEPSFHDGTLVSSRKGSANFTLAAFGIAAHAGRDFEMGKSAIVALSRFIHEAHALNDSKAGISINFGHIEGGGPVNIVPDFAILQINVRILHETDLEKIKESFHQLLKKITLETDVKMEFHEITKRAPKPFDEKTAKLFDILKKVGLQVGQEIKLLPSGGVSDGNILASVGLPTIDTLGVIGGNIHTHNEYMLIDSLKSRVKLTVSLLIELIKSTS